MQFPLVRTGKKMFSYPRFDLIVEVNLIHLRSTTKARASLSNNPTILAISSENRSVSTGKIGSALNGEQLATKVQLRQIESDATLSSDGVVAAFGQIADDAENGDVELALRVGALAFEELLRHAEGVVCELLVGADFLSGSGGISDGDIVELFSWKSMLEKF